MSNENAFDKQLWRDFKWDDYLASELPKCLDENEREELRKCVEIIRNVSRLTQDGPVRSKMKELSVYEQTIPPNLHFQIIMILSMVASVMYEAKHGEASRLTFAISTINQLAKLCRTYGIKEAEPILLQFSQEFREIY